MSTIYKALTRPPVLPGIGVPLVPFVIVEGALIALSANVSWFFLITTVAAWYIMKRMTKDDEAIFHLLNLKRKTLGVNVINRFYDATVFSASQYDAIDIKEITDCMKLNQRYPLEKVIPYSSHIDTQIVKTRDNDELATWEIIGTPFECEERNDLAIINTQLNTMIRAWEGKSVTFYTHRVREEYYDHLDTQSDNAFANEVSTKYYEGIKKTLLFRNRVFFTVCWMPFPKEQQLQHSMKKTVRVKVVVASVDSCGQSFSLRI